MAKLINYLNSDPVTYINLFVVLCVYEATTGKIRTSGFLEFSGESLKVVGELWCLMIGPISKQHGEW